MFQQNEFLLSSYFINKTNIRNKVRQVFYVSNEVSRTTSDRTPINIESLTDLDLVFLF